jgi:hypothetical protein
VPNDVGFTLRFEITFWPARLAANAMVSATNEISLNLRDRPLRRHQSAPCLLETPQCGVPCILHPWVCASWSWSRSRPHARRVRVLITYLRRFGIASAQSSPSSPDGQQAPAPATRSDPAPQSSGAPLADEQFAVQAALANMAEIQLGHLAVKNAKHPSVKKFAQMMIDDHLKTQNAWPTRPTAPAFTGRRN